MKKSLWYLVNYFLYLTSFMLTGSYSRRYTHELYKEDSFRDKYAYDKENGLVFFVKACKEAYVGVFQKYEPDQDYDLSITVVIGRQSNNYNYVSFRNATKGEFLKYTTVSEMPTNCDEFRPFWVNATLDYISIGYGTSIGKSLILEMHHNLNENTPNFFSFASASNIDSDWVWESCDDVVDPWASWTNCTGNRMKTRTRQNLTTPFEWNGKTCFAAETETSDCFHLNNKWEKIMITNSNPSIGLKEIVEAKSKIKCAGMCSVTRWCEFFHYLKQNYTCILIEDVSRAEPTSYKRRIIDNPL